MAPSTSSAFLLVFTGLGMFLLTPEAQINITAEPEDSVSLTCRAPDVAAITAVEWSRADLEPQYVFVYRSGRFDGDNQHPSFQNRVELKDEQMEDGDVSVTLKNLRVDDTGTYECRVNQRRRNVTQGIIHLRVEPGDNKGGGDKDGGDEGGGDEQGHVGLTVVRVIAAAPGLAPVEKCELQEEKKRQKMEEVVVESRTQFLQLLNIRIRQEMSVAEEGPELDLRVRVNPNPNPNPNP
ncbi:coxsackievirus and adenovirus receptor-like [Anabas testudineus]|uniref:coxsackievirus and adenovirus receptor-like n=1 Tax=Anabas testudineus TaxID=64144 RepID=UPI000E45CFCB|nr:coxsackievirus and adenovirus receptor-like [Anabas testudineus]